MKRFGIKLEFKNIYGKEMVIPYHLNYYIMGFFYKLIDDKKLHDSKGCKYFSFSEIILEEGYRKKSDGIHLKGNKGWLIFSSSDKKITAKLENALSNIAPTDIHNFGRVIFSITDYDVETNTVKNGNVFKCEFLSHSCVNKPGKERAKHENQKQEGYINPKTDTEEYIKYLKKNVNKKIGKNVDFSIIIDEDTVDSDEIHIMAKNVTKIKGYKYNFILKCDDLDSFNKLYYSGLGDKCSLGFGLFRVLSTEKN